MKYRFDYLVSYERYLETFSLCIYRKHQVYSCSILKNQRSFIKYLLPDVVSTTARTVATIIMAQTTAIDSPTKTFFIVDQLQ